MGGLEFLVIISLCTAVIGSASSQDKNQTEAMRKLEETVSYLQKQMLAKEQEQKLVLSDMISKWIMTTDQLNKLQQKYTVLENAQNSTSVDGAGKCFTHLEVAFEAYMAGNNIHSQRIQFQANSNLIFSVTQYNEGGCWNSSNGFTGVRVAFEAHMDGTNEHPNLVEFQANLPLIFSVTQYNEGGCWNSSNGVFTAPVNGTYMFWIDLAVRDDQSSPFTVALKRNEVVFDKVIRLQDDEDSSKLSRISLTPLVQGDLVKFVAGQRVKYRSSMSSCGGVLLH